MPGRTGGRKDDCVKRNATVNTAVCVACGACMKVCPRGAISIYRGCHAEVNEEKCVGCGLCGKTCPAGCIALAERSEVK